MRKYFLIGLFFGIVFSSKAQGIDYITFFHEGVRWISGEYDGNYHIRRSDEYYEIKGDSVIGEFQYKKLIWNGTLIGLIRDDGGNISFQLLKGVKYLPGELEYTAHDAILHKEYTLYNFVDEWKEGTPMCFEDANNTLMKEPARDTIRSAYLDTVQLANGKFYKKFKDMIYGFGHYLRGPLGFLIYERWWEGGFCLIELYDGDELIYRTTKYTFNDLQDLSFSKDLSVSYFSSDKLLCVETSLPEESYTIDLFNADGFKVLSFSGTSHSLDALLPGVYLVRARKGGTYFYESKIRIE